MAGQQIPALQQPKLYHAVHPLDRLRISSRPTCNNSAARAIEMRVPVRACRTRSVSAVQEFGREAQGRAARGRARHDGRVFLHLV